MALPPGTAAKVRLLGRVRHASELYAAADVVAVPSVLGSGVQEKAIEAIASGRPVVASGHALRGLGPGLPPQVHAADDAAAFARLCASVPAAPSGRAGEVAQAALAEWAAARRRRYDLALRQALRPALPDGEHHPLRRSPVAMP
jgi:polysaccharide biosynthesis protein PslH